MSAKNGKPCVKCGANEWYKSGDCVPCSNERSRRYQQANPEAEKERHRRWYQANQETVKEHSRRWKRANPEIVNERHRRYRQANRDAENERHRRYRQANPEAEKKRLRRWRQANPEAAAAQKHRRRTRETQAGGSFTAAEWRGLVQHYGNKCLCCGRTDVELTVDHVVPISKGGTSNIDNLQPLCGPCNTSKHDRTIDYRPGSGLGRWIQRKLFG